MTPQDATPSQLGLAFDAPETASATGAPAEAGSALSTRRGMEALLTRWQGEGWLRALDVQFARLLAELGDSDTASVTSLTMLLAALTSHQVGRGHVCMDIGLLVNDADATLALPPEQDTREPLQAFAFPLPSGLLTGVSLEQCLADLRASPVVSGPDSEASDSPAEGSDTATPLILDGSALYLRRFWRYENRIALGIGRRVKDAAADPLASPDSPAARTLADALNALYEKQGNTEPDDQKLASALSARNRFAIVTGGPGTGKTTTVVRLLAALQSVAGATADRKLRIRVAAPTGKAAARLNESIGGAVHRLPLSELPGAVILEDIPARVTTLHRLLGSRPGSRTFRHNRDHPLRVDVLVIDEASMVDVELMASVFDALPDYARLILLGDKDQLASVDAGAVLGELCEQAADGHYWPETRRWLESVTGERVPEQRENEAGRPLDQAVAMLRTSYRFSGDSGIGRLARAVNTGHLSHDLIADARNVDLGDVVWLQPRRQEAGQTGYPDTVLNALSEHALTGSPGTFSNRGEGRMVSGAPLPPPVGYRAYLEVLREQGLTQESPRSDWDALAARVLAAFGDFQVLSALRQGPWGVAGLNDRIAHRLHSAGLIRRTEGWYPGRPVLVTANDYNLGLMNGDVGIAMEVPWGETVNGEAQAVLRVAFPGDDGPGSIRWVAPSRLQHIDTVYAMTVHKSQGSEFTHTCLVLPDRRNPVLTRELVYTGITRARHWFSLVTGHRDILEQAVQSRVARASGLRAKL